LVSSAEGEGGPPRALRCLPSGDGFGGREEGLGGKPGLSFFLASLSPSFSLSLPSFLLPLSLPPFLLSLSFLLSLLPSFSLPPFLLSFLSLGLIFWHQYGTEYIFSFKIL
jgi:hypothetical protein